MKSYYNILIIDPLPSNLSSHVRKIHPPSLTNHSNYGSNRLRLDCIHAFISIKNNTQFMNIDELPQLFLILNQEGHNVDTSITKMILKTGVVPEGKKLIAYISQS
jgi:hypothetical protein